MPPNNLLYINGLERIKRGVLERGLQAYLALSDIDIHTDFAEADWYGRTYPELFGDVHSRAEWSLGHYGNLAIAGASAGGSLAANLYLRMRRDHPEADIAMMSLSGWLDMGDPQLLEWVALHRPNHRPSQAFLSSVKEYNDNTKPNLDETDKSGARTTRGKDDELVPTSSSGIEGVIERVVPFRRHMSSIVAGALLIPKMVGEVWPLPEVDAF